MTTETFSQAVARTQREQRVPMDVAQQIVISRQREQARGARAAPLSDHDGFSRGEGVTLKSANVSDKSTWIQLAKAGSFLGHSAGPFELDRKVFNELISNFYDQKNPVPIDFEHATEADPTVGSISAAGAPAQGWIVDLKIQGDDLWARVEWLPKAREMIRSGEYKYISPAIRFGSKDRVTGQPVGARLTSAGLTNMPFLDGMQALAAKDAPPITFTELTMRVMAAKKCSLSDAQAEANRILRARS